MGTYIDESAILWLCENENPAVKHLSKKEFFAGEPTNADYREMSRYVSFIHKNNCSTKNRFDSTFGQAAFLCFAAECGMRCDDEPLAGLIDSLIRKSLTESGGFSPDWKHLRPCAAWSASILKALLRSGYTGKEVHSCAQWLAEIQLKDGGWNTNPSAGFFCHWTHLPP